MHRTAGIDSLKDGAVASKLLKIKGADLRFTERRWAHRLVIDDQHTVRRDDDAIDLTRQRTPRDQADDGHFGLRVRPPERGKFGGFEHRNGFAANVLLL